MGSAASTKKTVNGSISSANESNTGGKTEEIKRKSVNNTTPAVGRDENVAEPAKQNLIISSNATEESDTENGGTPKEIEDASITALPDVPLIDIATAKAKRFEEFSQYVKHSLDWIKVVIKHVQNCQEFPCNSCLEIMDDITSLSCELSGNDKYDFADGLVLIDTEYCKMFAYVWKKREMLQKIEEADSDDDNLTPETQDIFTFFIDLLGSTWNFTDRSDDFCVQLDQDECLSLIVDWLIFHHESEKTMNKWIDDMSNSMMSILINACRRVPSLSPKHHHVVPVLQKFGESEETLTQIKAFMTLAKLVRKEEADKLSTNYTCIVSLLTLLKESLSNTDHKVMATHSKLSSVTRFPAVELVQAVEELATNDKNKKLIVEKGGIPILAKLLEDDCSNEEKTFAANAIWRLAFLKENKEQLRKDHGIIYNLSENSKSENEKLRNSCMGALFEIFESRLPENVTGRKTDNGPPQKAQSDSVASSGHIMLSYKWEHPSKPVMREFKKQLRSRGYKVWMDEDHMMGDKIGAMADAVENADMIIACITRGYQDSQDCRTEASYAYECKKKIIPIKVGEFKPTGWLGGITAGKIYYMVQEADHVSNVLPSIIEKEFAVQRDKAQDVNAAPGPPPPNPEPKPPAADSHVPGWDSKKVQDWLAANNVGSRHEGLKNVSGKQLLQLKKQLATSPQTFYQYMVENLKVPYLDVMSLAAALEDLKGE